MPHTLLELVLIPPTHDRKLFCNKLKRASTVAVAFSMTSSTRMIANVTFFRASRSSVSLVRQLGNSAKASATFRLVSSGLVTPSSVSLQSTKYVNASRPFAACCFFRASLRSTSLISSASASAVDVCLSSKDS